MLAVHQVNNNDGPEMEELRSLFPDHFHDYDREQADDRNIFNRTVGSPIPIIIGQDKSKFGAAVGGVLGHGGGGGGGNDDADGFPPRRGSPYVK